MERIAIFPGSFDPITTGHTDIVERAAPLFDKIIVSIGQNIAKNYMYSQEQRKKWIEDTFKNTPNVEVDFYQGLTIEYCKEKNASYILRGLRTSADFEFEKAIAHTNREISEIEIETVFLLTSSEKSFISSSIVRDVIKNGGNIKNLVPDPVFQSLKNS
ncbi:MAG: pantetheine-phosphate adenylyltransferase [Flavobacteriaceae bacterium]|nr:MAG: pantetheine-phosphate adenylyltransferase [Flavobacteriaceae bacterium]